MIVLWLKRGHLMEIDFFWFKAIGDYAISELL
jgi:hypothetical protein